MGTELTIGKKIQKYRKLKHLTQKQLAELAGVNEITIRSYEGNRFRPKYDTVVALCSALDIPLSILLDNSISEPKSTSNTQVTPSIVRETTPYFTLDNLERIEELTSQSMFEQEKQLSLSDKIQLLNENGYKKLLSYIDDLLGNPVNRK